jgi:hypothetical protein
MRSRSKTWLADRRCQTREVTMEVQVTLNQAEEKMVASLPEALRAQVTESILAAKREAMTTLIANRTTFSWKLNEGGTIVIRGLGNRFPTGMRADSLEILLSHTEQLKQAIEASKKYIAENPEKVAAFEKARDKKRKAERKLTLVGVVNSQSNG